MRMKSLSLAVLCSGLMLCLSVRSGRAETIIEVVNVNCGGHKAEPESSMNGRANPADRPVAPAAYSGATWSDGFGWNRDRLKNSEKKATTVSFHVTRDTGFGQNWRGNELNLLKGGWSTQGKDKSLEISGLDQFHRYELYLPSQNDYGRKNGGWFSTANVSDAGDKTLVSTGTNLNGATWVEGEDYVVFRNIVPSDKGEISVSFKGTLNGFQLVRKEPRPSTTISLERTAGTASSKFGDSLTFTAAVAGVKPTGKVIFLDGEAMLDTVALDGASRASITTNMLAGGAHRVTARYVGDAKNAPSVSAPLSQSVTDNRPATTTTLTVAGGAKAFTHGHPVTFNVTVAGAKPTGKVIFYDYDGKIVTPIGYYDSRYGKDVSVGANDLPPIGTSTLNASFQASVTTSSLAWGRHSITARYEGDMGNAPSGSAAPCILDVKPRAGNGKLKVFILSGQSNMEGHGSIEWGGNFDEEKRRTPVIGGLGSLRGMVVNNPDRYGCLLEPNQLVTPSGEKKPRRFATRNDVWISYWDSVGANPAGERRNGALSAGFGDSNGEIGPEYGFGQIVGNAMADPVLIIKVAWGGKSLAKDFRPSSSGGTVGKYYSLMVERVHEVLNNLKKYYPEYQDQGYEIVGFGWHQGWNDRIDEKRTAEYETNLVNFIKDVRAEFKAPKMPFVVATTAMSKANIESDAVKLIAAQTAVSDPARHPEFAGTVATVDTRPFDYGDNSREPWGGYHWNYNGESYFHIGESMGLAMMDLLTREGPRQ